MMVANDDQKVIYPVVVVEAGGIMCIFLITSSSVASLTI